MFVTRIQMEMSYSNEDNDSHKQTEITEEEDIVSQALERLEENNKKETEEEKTSVSHNWKIKIDKISLDACIAEGTSAEVLNQYVGHFEETDLWNGNVGLAAHNRGYPVNYFSRVKELVLGDKITYFYKNQERTYEVTCIKIINDSDWSMLKNTKENTVTLITCVENEPSQRRCVQATELNHDEKKE